MPWFSSLPGFPGVCGVEELTHLGEGRALVRDGELGRDETAGVDGRAARPHLVDELREGAGELGLVAVLEGLVELGVEGLELGGGRVRQLVLPPAEDAHDHCWAPSPSRLKRPSSASPSPPCPSAGGAPAAPVVSAAPVAAVCEAGWAVSSLPGVSATSSAWAVSPFGPVSASSVPLPAGSDEVGVPPPSWPFSWASSRSTWLDWLVLSSSACRGSVLPERSVSAPEAMSSSMAPARACIWAILSCARCMAMPVSLMDSEIPATASPMFVCAWAAV